MKKTATIIRHAVRPNCFIGKILEDNDFNVTVIISPTFDYTDFDALAPDLVYIGGGPIGVYQAELYPFLYKEMDIIKARHDAGKPTFGICLGGQLIAKALGGDVHPGHKGLEFAWRPLSLTDEASDHPVRHLCGTKTNMFHWHGDMLTLPPNAVRLASSDLYPNQIFEVGNNTLGFQCHTEVTHTMLDEWCVRLVDELTGSNPLLYIDDFREQAARLSPILNEQTRLFFTEWLERASLL